MGELPVSPTVIVKTHVYTPQPEITFTPPRFIAIPEADWLSESYHYYDRDLDSTFTIPAGWKITQDLSKAGLAMPGTANPPPLGKDGCYDSWKKFFKDFSQCQTI